MSEPRISVVIPVQNEADKIERCLEAVLSQSLKPHEVIVVDGHSTDGTIEKVEKFPVKLRYEGYHTRGGARQVGMENAQGEYVAFTDASCIPGKNWLQNLVKEFSEGVIGVGGQTRNIGSKFWTRSINLAFSTFLGSANSVQGRLFKEKRTVSSISGCNSIYRKQDILEVGGFDINFTSEDADLNRRLIKKGKLLYTPEAVVLHDQGRDLKEFAEQMYRWGMARVLARKWELPVIPPLLVIPLLLSLIFTLWVLLAALGLYLLVIIAMGAMFATKEKNIRYLISIPIAYLVEHGSYTAGFWRELIWPHRAKIVIKKISTKLDE